jgi:Sugar (and other) transporter
MSKKPQIRVSVVIVVFLCSPALAAAQDVSPAPAGTRPLGGPVMWVLLGEMFPNQLRGAALAVSGATNWVVNFAVTVTFLPLLDAVGLAGAYGLTPWEPCSHCPSCGPLYKRQRARPWNKCRRHDVPG